MKEFIGRVLSRWPRSEGLAEQLNSELTHGDLASCYQQIIRDCLRRLLVADDSVELEIRRTGRTARGLTSYAGYVKILRWDPVVSTVLLQNLPVIDARIRSLAKASVMLEHTSFDGLWVRADEHVQGAPSKLVGLPAGLVVQPQAQAPAATPTPRVRPAAVAP